jgi:hypothetical protein
MLAENFIQTSITICFSSLQIFLKRCTDFFSQQTKLKSGEDADGNKIQNR